MHYDVTNTLLRRLRLRWAVCHITPLLAHFIDTIATADIIAYIMRYTRHYKV